MNAQGQRKMIRNLKYKRKLVTDAKYTDIHRGFIPSLKGDISIVQDQKQIEQQISGIILTKKGECPLDPEFGCNLPDALFENMDSGTTYIIQQSIQEAILKYEPRVQNVTVNTEAKYDTNSVLVTITYFIKNVNESQTLEYELTGN